MDYLNIYADHNPAEGPLLPLLNRGFLTGMVTCGALLVWRRMLRFEGEELATGFSTKAIYRAMLPTIGLLAFVTGFLEVDFQGN